VTTEIEELWQELKFKNPARGIFSTGAVHGCTKQGLVPITLL
jgi:hypothetical protein